MGPRHPFVGPTPCRCAASARSTYLKSLISAQISTTTIDPASFANPSRRVSGSALGATFRPAREHQGLGIASDRFLTWDEVGAELKPLKPRRLVLIACKGGRASGANDLFRRLPDLRRIYACPVNCSKDLGRVMLGLVPVAVEKKAPRRELIRYAQGLTALSVGGQLRHWARNEDKDNPHGHLLDVFADFIDTQVRQLPHLFASMLG